MRPPSAMAPAAVAVRFAPDAARPVPAAAPRITRVALLVMPPAYTRRAAFVPAAASFQCPQGSRVRWLVTVNSGRDEIPTLEISDRKVALQPVAGQPTQFAGEQVLSASALYRLRYAGQTSDDYAVEVRPDQAPAIRLQTPKPYTLIAAVGTRPQVPVRATLRDDYGLTRAELVITVAQGQGEAVKFREVRRDLSAGLGGLPTEATVGSLLNLPPAGPHLRRRAVFLPASPRQPRPHRPLRCFFGAVAGYGRRRWCPRCGPGREHRAGLFPLAAPGDYRHRKAY